MARLDAEESALHQLEFEIAGVARSVAVDDLIIAGWTGRDAVALECHIAELAVLGVKRPSTTPCFYRVGANLLTSDAAIDATGSDSSGEVEFVLVSLADGLHVGIGSDHTDRRVEAYSVLAAKQMCPKPIGRELWRFSDLASHWNELTLRSWVTRDGKRDLYQEGAVTDMLAPQDLVARYLGTPGTLHAGTVMFGGTLTVIGDITAGDRFEIELEDGRSRRSLQHAYDVRSLAVTE
jgi:hypothetical protein